MKRRVEQMINGKFEYEVPKLILSQERIQIRTSCKKNSQGEIYLGTKENCKIRVTSAPLTEESCQRSRSLREQR